jgi:hypothetical protein
MPNRENAPPEPRLPEPKAVAGAGYPLVEIDMDRLVADRHDQVWQEFLRKARRHRKVLRERGRLK